VNAPGARGSLAVVGTGYLGAGQITPEALAYIDRAEKLFCLGGDPATRLWLGDRNPTYESLYDAYRVGGDRRLAYRDMVRRILDPVRRGLTVCAAFYGHPGVFVNPAHEAIRQARAAGYSATMRPGISAEDCLFADVEFDPARRGCQSYEASYFLVYAPRFDVRSALVLWQVGAVGVGTYEKEPLWGEQGLSVLVETLLRHYPPDHEVVLYEAAIFSVCEPRVARVPLAQVAAGGVTVHTTLYLPPRGDSPPDRRVAARLRLPRVLPKTLAAPRPPQRSSGRAPGRRVRAGSLTVVGAGYAVAGQVTPEARAQIELADQVFYLMGDPFTAVYLRSLNRRTTSLHDSYRPGRSGAAAAAEMVERLLAAVRNGRQVCAAFYGHPAVLMEVTHEALRRARAEGHEARMLPGISAADCLFADLGLDPGVRGCQLYDATDFVLRPRAVEPATPLILLQAGAVGVTRYRARLEGSRPGLQVLAAALGRHYPPDHPVTIYEIPPAPLYEPRIDTVPLARLTRTPLKVYSTLYVAPAREPRLSEDMVRRLHLEALLADHRVLAAHAPVSFRSKNSAAAW